MRGGSALADVWAARSNGLNTLRLGCAVAVIISHTWTLTGHAREPHLGHLALGRIGVGGFFAISGFLVTGTRLKFSGARHFQRRLVRIFPGYWVALTLTAFVAMPLEWWREHHSLAGLPIGQAFRYLGANAFLYQGQHAIGSTLAHNPFPSTWNGSIWTLSYEFLCYLMVTILAGIGLLRAWAGVVVLGVDVALIEGTEAGNHLASHLMSYQGIAFIAELSSYFAAGLVLRLWASHIPVAWPWAVGAAGLVVAGAQQQVPDPVVALPLAYLCFYVGARLPWGPTQRHDISYSMYLYGFPVSQLLVAAGLAHDGLIAVVPAALLGTLPLALGSWYLLERPALRYKDATVAFPRRRPSVIVLPDVRPSDVRPSDAAERPRVAQQAPAGVVLGLPGVQVGPGAGYGQPG
jgi:peptidoglycan/LPS O-acetylase OafA/YrhL